MSVLGPFIGGERSFGIRRAEAVVDRSNGVRLERVCKFNATLWRYENSLATLWDSFRVLFNRNSCIV